MNLQLAVDRSSSRRTNFLEACSRTFLRIARSDIPENVALQDLVRGSLFGEVFSGWWSNTVVLCPMSRLKYPIYLCIPKQRCIFDAVGTLFTVLSSC